MKVVHNDKTYDCDLCDKSFKQRQFVLLHMNADHNKTKRYKCDTCDSEFYCESNLQAHIENVHKYNQNNYNVTFVEKNSSQNFTYKCMKKRFI